MGIRPRMALTGAFVMAGAVLLSIGAGQPTAARERRAVSPSVPPLGNLIISRSLYTAPDSTVAIGQPLPGGGLAVATGAYPDVFNNAAVDGSFGVTSPIFI